MDLAEIQHAIEELPKEQQAVVAGVSDPVASVST
jgi:hypothetical protein